MDKVLFPINGGIVRLEPGQTEDNGVMRRVDDVEDKIFLVIPENEFERYCLLSYRAGGDLSTIYHFDRDRKGLETRGMWCWEAKAESMKHAEAPESRRALAWTQGESGKERPTCKTKADLTRFIDIQSTRNCPTVAGPDHFLTT